MAKIITATLLLKKAYQRQKSIDKQLGGGGGGGGEEKICCPSRESLPVGDSIEERNRERKRRASNLPVTANQIKFSNDGSSRRAVRSTSVAVASFSSSYSSSHSRFFALSSSKDKNQYWLCESALCLDSALLLLLLLIINSPLLVVVMMAVMVDAAAATARKEQQLYLTQVQVQGEQSGKWKKGRKEGRKGKEQHTNAKRPIDLSYISISLIYCFITVPLLLLRFPRTSDYHPGPFSSDRPPFPSLSPPQSLPGQRRTRRGEKRGLPMQSRRERRERERERQAADNIIINKAHVISIAAAALPRPSHANTLLRK